jgi:hypothetical protein
VWHKIKYYVLNFVKAHPVGAEFLHPDREDMIKIAKRKRNE